MSVDQCLAQHGYSVVTNPYHSLEKMNKKTDRKMFSQTDYMEQDSTKNRLTYRVSKYTLSVQK